MITYLASQVGEVVSVSRSATHTFSKEVVKTIKLLAGQEIPSELSSRQNHFVH